MTQAAVLGYPHFGAKRELKRALEGYWAGRITAADLLEGAKQLRLRHWRIQQSAGIDVIPSNDFSLYDHVLDTTCMVGAVPERYTQQGSMTSLDTYFAMARGVQHGDLDIPAMEMTKWFDTNYHYIVPEIAKNQTFQVASTKVADEFVEARGQGIATRPVLLGPVSYLLLSKSDVPQISPLEALPRLVPVYVEVLQQLAAAGADWVQIDEPCLALDLDESARAAYREAYAQLAQLNGPHLMLTTYFGGLGDNLSLAVGLPTAGLHVDLVRDADQLAPLLAQLPDEKTLSMGVVDGRNVWRTDLESTLAQVQLAASALGTERIQIASSCSLLFCPHDLELETELDPELRSWLAFARQKLDELGLLKRALTEGLPAVGQALAANQAVIENRRRSPRTHTPSVRARLAAIDDEMLQRVHHYPERKALQDQHIPLPPLPTTTIGSFPQTAEVRSRRRARNRGEITQAEYVAFLQEEITRAIRLQEDIGLDVLVHGEFERSDMVEYFGQQLTGIDFTKHGWVQSYGSRGVRPPIIYGDVARPNPMTVSWSAYAQSLTEHPLKGMITGPVTILQWSFVRDDQPRSVTCQQIALALRDEALDLEKAGIRIIQIDEPALREGLPLRQADQDAYLEWAVDAFRLTAGGVHDETQIHTHMCYAEFNDIIEAIARMDADVISIEASRSKMELLDAFRRYAYPNAIGPGMYDIHSPRIPPESEFEALIEKALQILAVEQLWVNPDCGLKTRRWKEVIPALRNMVRAARRCRQRLVDTPR